MGELLHHYHIADRCEKHEDADDEGGSRAFPSRTYWGATWSAGASQQGGCKFPYLIETRRFFFGLIEVPCWGYRCGLTHAQIDLLLADQPVVDYVRDKKKDKKRKRDKRNENPAHSNVSEAKALDAQMRLEQKRAEGKATLDLSQYDFNGKKLKFTELK